MTLSPAKEEIAKNPYPRLYEDAAWSMVGSLHHSARAECPAHVHVQFLVYKQCLMHMHSGILI